MEAVYKRELPVPMSMCDFRQTLGTADTVALFMDMAAEVTELLGIGLSAMEEQKFYWLTVRTRCRFHRRPAALTPVTAATWARGMQKAVCNRYYTLSAGDELLVEGKTEWLVYDVVTGGVAKTLSDGFYAFPTSAETVCDGARVRMSREFAPEEELGRYTVRSTDIDIGRHMNNVAYIRALLSLFTVAQQETLDIRELEIGYHSPAMEGEELRVYRRETEDGLELCVFLPDGRLSATAKLWLGSEAGRQDA